MTKILNYCFLFFKTIYDVGLPRITLRFIFELRNLTNYIFYRFFIFRLNKLNHLKYWNSWDFNLLYEIKNDSLVSKLNVEKIKLYIFNKEITLIEPINWNKHFTSRLANFYLNYFDWSRKLISDYLRNNKKNNNLRIKLIFLIDSWIDFNSNNYGDGWHPYTVSLRIRNWIWIFRLFPEIINKKRINFLWIQMNWLNKHQEIHLGGNHYLENLMSLVISSIQFNDSRSVKIFEKSIIKLEKELNKQILKDGGHEERSSSYHLNLLSTLVELACFLQYEKGLRPIWIIEKIKIMTDWSTKIILNNSKYPRFNDSVFDDQINIKEIINFSMSYLNQKNFLSNKHSLHNILISRIFKNNISKIKFNNYLLANDFKDPYIESLTHTGWIIFHPSKDWEVTFKGGISGPKYLHGHAQSDILTFDIFKKSNPIIVETGTSEYDYSNIRKYERSGNSHNVMQFSNKKDINLEDFLDWSESVEVWSSFRAARKPKILSLSSGIDKNNFLWAECTYKPFQRYLIYHQRILKMKVSNENHLHFFVTDKVFARRNIYWRSNIHLAPNQKRSILSNLYNSNNDNILSYSWNKSWTSNQFGKRDPSETLILYGQFKGGKNINNLKLKLI